MLSHKIRLKPSNKQATYFKKACGTSRFTYNWALAKWNEQYKLGEKPSPFKLKTLFNSIKKEEYPWVYEVTKTAAERSFTNLGTAFSKFFKKTAKYPKFKKKGVSNTSFYISNDKFVLNGKFIKVPKLGWVRMREEPRFSGEILSATISCRADQWFVSISTKDEISKTIKNQDRVGIDLGVKDLAILSTGEKFKGPKPHKALLKRLRLLNKSLARKKKGSRNREKARLKLAKLHLKISNIRLDYLHRLSTSLSGRFNHVCMEDLNVSGMLKNHKLARAISDMGWSELKRQLEYKANSLLVIDRWFPSSKMCNECGLINKDLKLSDRLWTCACGAHHDRDVNAALNIRDYTAGLAG